MLPPVGHNVLMCRTRQSDLLLSSMQSAVQLTASWHSLMGKELDRISQMPKEHRQAELLSKLQEQVCSSVKVIHGIFQVFVWCGTQAPSSTACSNSTLDGRGPVTGGFCSLQCIHFTQFLGYQKQVIRDPFVDCDLLLGRCM